MNKTIEDRIEFLRECADLYETNGTSPLSDAEYDQEYAELKKIASDNPFFTEVGGIKHDYGTEVKHKYIMGSLEKDANPEDFGKWFDKTYPNPKGLLFTVTPKVDGSSICVHYDAKGKKSLTVTRGDGEIGFDVTPNSDYVEGIPNKIQTKVSLEVKGECFKNRQDFYENWVGEYKNPRNFASGSLNQKDPLVTKERGLSFVAYEIRGDAIISEVAKTEILEAMGFETLAKFEKVFKGEELTNGKAAEKIQEYMNSLDRENLHFDIDGVVFKLNDVLTAQAMGTTDGGKRPKSNRAIKFPCEIKESRLLSVEWSTGRTGRINPVALIEPTELCNTTVSRVTLNNVKEILDNGYTIGGMLKISKRGEIIPHIEGVVSSTNTPVEIPTKCDSCGSPLHPDSTNTTLWCKNGENCEAQIVANICNYLAKIGIKDIASGIVTKLSDNGYVNCISDVYKLKDKNQAALKSLLGNKIYSNTLKNISSVSEISLAKLIECLGIGKVGRTSKDITAVYPTIEDIDALTVEKMCAIDGFSTIKSQGFIDGWGSMRDEIDEILQFVKIVEPVKAGNTLEGKSFCVTGTLSRKRGDIQKDIELNGGVVRSSVSAKLDYLVCGENSGGKLNKAKKFGVTVISEEELTNMMK